MQTFLLARRVVKRFIGRDRQEDGGSNQIAFACQARCAFCHDQNGKRIAQGLVKIDDDGRRDISQGKHECEHGTVELFTHVRSYTISSRDIGRVIVTLHCRSCKDTINRSHEWKGFDNGSAKQDVYCKCKMIAASYAIATSKADLSRVLIGLSVGLPLLAVGGFAGLPPVLAEAAVTAGASATASTLFSKGNAVEVSASIRF